MRLLLLADTHIGFDLPLRPRIQRRRRGHDFLDNFRRALAPARQGQVDLVVHGGDLLFRSKVPPGIVEMAMAPLVEVARAGVPVFLVPGNHERSRIPLHLWARHPGIHVFDRPRTFVHAVGGMRVALGGFPFARDVRSRFRHLVEATGLQRAAREAAPGAGVSLLCMHQAVEGARVEGYTFRRGADVVRAVDLPPVHAVLSGHIHRAQVLKRGLDGAPLAAPVIYPGSVERTSWAEQREAKVFATLDCSARTGAPVVGEPAWKQLPARPMVDVRLASCGEAARLQAALAARLRDVRADAVVRVHLEGPWTAAADTALTAANLRALAPPTMNISLARHPSMQGARGGVRPRPL